MGHATIEYDDDDVVGDCDEVEMLFELVGARHLVLRDEDDIVRGIDPSSVQPFCIVKYDGTRIHKTKPSEDSGCNPIWTPHSSKSVFLLRTTARAMSHSILNISLHTKINGSLPSVMSKVTSVFLGQVHIDSNIILSHCDEKRFELNIEDELGKKISNLGKLALRCRVATPSDIKMVSGLNRECVLTSQRELADVILDPTKTMDTTPDIFSKRTDRRLATLVTEKDNSEMAQNSFVQSARNIFTSQTSTCSVTGQTMVRVKPYPDPDRQEKTEFLKPYDLKLETRSPSTKWVEAGSGKIGRLFVEIISCDDLPNLDSGGELLGNFTDSFCTLVYEDTCAMTDVIYDELNPRWLPWTKRAFSFNVMHPASILYLGVFDFDILGSHDPIGRVAVNVCNLQRDTIHTINYNLYPSSNVTERKAAGRITIRLRMEWFDPRAALLAAWKSRPIMHVNVSKEKTFRVVRYTCFGEYDNPEHFDITLTRSYINEIFEYKTAISYVLSDASRSLILWRGQVEICSVMLPLHSLIFFVFLSRLVEKPQLIVPYSLLGIAWIMLANLTIRRQHPSPWQSRLSFLDYLNILRTGKSSIPIKCIKKFEGAEAAKAYELAWKERVDKDRKIAEKKAELLQEISDIGDVNIHTQVPNQALIPVDILNRLGRYQGIMSRLCKKFRLMKIILTWEESIVSFFVTATFLSAGLVALILPWGFILTWIGRIVVWGFLGPHMKLVDLFLRANEKKDGRINDLVKNFDIQSNRARLRREKALKVKDMKEVAFGTFSVHVPSFNLSRHYDRPLPHSSSRVCRERPARFHIKNSRRVSVTDLGRKNPLILGQQLYGCIIPRPEYDEEIHKYEIIVAEQKIQSLKDCLRRINGLDGLSELKRRQLVKLDTLVEIPMSIGYEVVPFEVSESVSTDSNSTEDIKCDSLRPCSLRSVSVKLMSDKLGYVDAREAKYLILESDGTSTYCVSEYREEVEETIEVIRTDRFCTSSYNNHPGDEESSTSVNSHVSHATENGLPCVLEYNENMQVVCLSPSEGAILKCKI